MDFDGIGYLKDFPTFAEGGDPLCGTTDPDLFFPVDQPEYSRKNIEFYTNEKDAKALCAQCPYKMQCASYALERLDLEGIWGGTTQIERRRLMRQVRRRNIARML